MEALLTGMLSIPITIPEKRIVSFRHNLKYRTYENTSRTSRALTRKVNNLLFDVYQHFIELLVSTLRSFEWLRADEVSSRPVVYLYCTAILIIVITCKFQTSLMDNGRLASLQPPSDSNSWEITFEQLCGVESAFKNSILFADHKNTSISDTKLLNINKTSRNFINQTWNESLLCILILSREISQTFDNITTNINTGLLSDR